eukprot:scaffold64473_cov30-Tisochrysis_lutea.AAC.2
MRSAGCDQRAIQLRLSRRGRLLDSKMAATRTNPASACCFDTEESGQVLRGGAGHSFRQYTRRRRQQLHVLHRGKWNGRCLISRL